MKTHIVNTFKSLYGEPELIVRSPGRINLIGEHTDYNEGFVFPAAIDKEIIFAVSKNSKKKFRFYAIDLEESFEIDIEKVSISETKWANYLLGVIDQIHKSDTTIEGVDCVFGGNIPIGAGLSSSAALENGFALALNILFDLKLEKDQLIKIAQKAEHEYAGVKCGIMDQFASMFGKKDQALILDCRKLSSKYVQLDLEGYSIILVDTKVSHDLAISEYNTRRIECETGVKLLEKYYRTIKALRDVTTIMLERHQAEFDPTIYKRCKFVVEENLRVKEAGKALRKNDLLSFGKLMFQSHEGLKNEYEVSCKELDLLTDIAKESTYVIGARMMGGGFGGCTINIVKKEYEDDFCNLIKKEYLTKTGIKTEIYKVNIVNGTSIIEI